MKLANLLAVVATGFAGLTSVASAADLAPLLNGNFDATSPIGGLGYTTTIPDWIPTGSTLFDPGVGVGEWNVPGVSHSGENLVTFNGGTPIGGYIWQPLLDTDSNPFLIAPNQTYTVRLFAGLTGGQSEQTDEPKMEVFVQVYGGSWMILDSETQEITAAVGGPMVEHTYTLSTGDNPDSPGSPMLIAVRNQTDHAGVLSWQARVNVDTVSILLGVPSDPSITDITRVSGDTDLWQLTLSGAADTRYEFRSSTTLEFNPGTRVESLTAGDPPVGTITSNSVVTTDGNGDATVRMTLTGPANFVRAQDPAGDPPRVPSIDIVAYRPQSESLQRRPVSEVVEEAIGAGIRANGDDDDGDGVADREGAEVVGENDLIEVELRFDLEPAPEGTEYVIKRSNSNLRVWASSSKGAAILDALDEATIEAVAAVQSVWVESPEGGEADLTFELRDIQTLQGLASDEVHFYSFSSLVVGLHGEFQFPTDPVIGPNEGISELAVALYIEGYDSKMYVENAVASDGSGPVYDEIVDAVQNRGVTSVAVYGFSHGGGSVYDLTERLQTNQASIGDFDIDFTGYIDAIENDSNVDLDPEIRLPPGTQHHVNYYQQWGFIAPWGGAVAGADVDVNVTITSWGSFLWHNTITNSAEIQAGIHDPLVFRVQR